MPTTISFATVGRRHLPGDAPHPARLLGVQAEGRRVAELTEAAFEVLIQEGIEHRIQAAVDVAQRDAEVHQHQREQAAQVEAQSLSQDHDLDWGPADHKCRHHHQHHPGDAPQVAILLLGAGQDADVAQALNHQTVADADDSHRDEEGEEENAGAQDRIPVTLWFRQNHDALNG